MKCDNQLLEAYVDQFLGENEKQIIEQHLKICSQCQQVVSELQSEQQQVIAMLNRPTLRESLADDIMQQIDKPIVKKRRWQFPLTVAATAMLAVGLMYMNKDEILTNSGLQQEAVQKGQIMIENVTVETGQINIWFEVHDINGEQMKLEELAQLKIFVNDEVDIAQQQTIIFNETDGLYHYVIELTDMSYDELTILVTYPTLNISKVIDVDAANIINTTVIDDVQINYQGKRFINNQHEIFYRIRYAPSTSEHYEQLHEQFLATYGNIGQSNFYLPAISYSLYDANGLMLVGERFDSGWEGANLSLSGSNTRNFGEYAWTLTLGEQYGNFPLTMRVDALVKTVPLMKEVAITQGQPTSFTIDDATYEVTNIERKQNESVITIEGKMDDEQQLNSMYVFYDNDLHYVSTKMDEDGDKTIYELTTQEQPMLPREFAIVISSVTNKVAVEPIDIILN